MDIEKLNELAEDYVNNTGVSVFLTGKAGTGKTTFLKKIVSTTPKRCVVLAPTGVAAVNAGGVTIHSFFQLPLCPYLPDVKELVTEYQMPAAKRQLRKEKVNIIRTLDLLIIDEISMVRADLLDAVDACLRRYRRSDRPFGGVQLLMIGDVQQLPPVVTESERPYIEKVYASPFFFSAKVMKRLQYITIELQHVYRQADRSFLDILNGIREGHFTPAMQAALNARLNPSFEPDSKSAEWIRLTTHNAQADAVNRRNLELLPGRLYRFGARVDGNFPESAYPADNCLELKKGAQVMFLRNDSDGRYFNGKIGVVTDIDSNSIEVLDTEGKYIQVDQEKWENIKYEINDANGEIEARVDGTFIQYPLRQAWAVTIHKSQGLTFDRVIIDAASAFTFGQVYVALSRCRTLEGIVLSSPISASCFFDNADVSGFCKSFPESESVSGQLSAFGSAYYFDTLADFFDLGELVKLYGWAYGLMRSHLKNTYPKQTQQLSALSDRVHGLADIAMKFRNEILRIRVACGGNTADGHLDERVQKAVGYFLPQLTDIAAETAPLLAVSIDNKAVKKDFSEVSKELLTQLGIVINCMQGVQTHGFSVSRYLKDRTSSYLNSTSESGRQSKDRQSKEKQPKEKSAKAEARDIYADNRHPELIEPLTDWRTEKYIERDVPAYVILSQKALLGIADACPRTKEEFLAIPGLGPSKWLQYGQEILDLLAAIRPM